MSNHLLTLDALAHRINVGLTKSDDYQISVAVQLAEAKRRVEAGEAGGVITFEEWCAKHIRTKTGQPRAMSEVRRYLSYAKNPDTVVEKVEKRREQTAEKQARHRNKPHEKSGLRYPIAPPQRSGPMENVEEERTGEEIRLARAWLSRALQSAEMARTDPIETCPRTIEMLAAVAKAAFGWTAVYTSLNKEP